VLAVGPDDVDTIRLERLVRSGRESAAAGDPHAAAQHHRAALALVRGPALEDIAHYGFARDAATWLDELVLGSHEGLMDALLATGAHDEVVSTLSGLVRTHAMRERLHAQLILALYRGGRQADALRAYQDARNVLLDELGVDPGPELRALEQAILSHDPSLDLPTGAVAPVAPAPVADAIVMPVRLPIIGREPELALLRTDLDSALSGRGRVVVLGGEPGIGKTRLVEELSDESQLRGAALAWGRGYEGQGVPAYWPWTQVITELVNRFDPEVVLAALGTDGPELAQIAPELKELIPDHQAPPPVDPASAQFRLSSAVSGLLSRLAAVRPITVVLDDLHWADPSSLGLLSFLATDVFVTPLLIMGTFRDIDPSLGGALADTLVDLGRRSNVRRIDLAGLDQDGIEQLLQAGGASTDPALLARVERRTGGNPFFISELVRLLPTEEARVAAAKAEAVSYGQTVPASVKGVISQRVARLPEATIGTLGVAATLGQDFDLSVLAATIDADGATLLDHLEPAIAERLIIDNPSGATRYRFAHGLVNETIYGDLGAAVRARTHQRIAAALEVHHGGTDGPHLLAIATHWFHAVPAAPADPGIDAAVRAAHWAQAHVAHQQAEMQLRAALELIADMPEGRERSMRELAVQDQLSLLLVMATSYTDPEFGRVCARVRQLCQEVEDHTLMVPALWRLFMNHFMRSDITAGMELGHELLSLDGADETLSKLAGSTALAFAIHQDGDQVAARTYFDQSIALCDAGHDIALRRFIMEDPPAFVRVFSAINWWLVGDEEHAETDAAEAFYIAARDGTHTWATMISIWGASTVSVLRRDPAAVVERCDYGLELAVAGGYGLGVPYMRVNRGWAMAAMGDVEAGERLLADGMAIADAFGAEYMRPAFHALRADVDLMAGRPDDALATVTAGLSIVEVNGEHWFESELQRLRGQALVATGEREAGRRAIREAIDVATRQGAIGFSRRAEADLAALA
jgi:hypothetical protein